MHEWWVKRLQEAGVDHFPMHELRHTAGTEFHRASKDLKKTQLFMRHKSINTTADMYLHLDREDLEDAMRLAYLRWSGGDEEADSMPHGERPRGADQIRTGVRGFAGLCLTTRPRRLAAGHGIPGVLRNPALERACYPHASLAPAASGRFASSAWKHR